GGRDELGEQLELRPAAVDHEHAARRTNDSRGRVRHARSLSDRRGGERGDRQCTSDEPHEIPVSEQATLMLLRAPSAMREDGTGCARFSGASIQEIPMAATAVDTEVVEQELVELEKQYWQTMKDKDVETALKLTD